MRFLPKRVCRALGLSIDKDCKQDGTDLCWDDTCEFTFPIIGGRVIKVYDGDTITIAAKMPYKTSSPVFRFSVRLYGIDAPEMKGKGISEQDKKCAQEAQQFVSDLILNKYVTLKNVQSEKYGRILADVYIGEIHLNELLLKERYAVPYSGTTKVIPGSWLKYKMTGEFV
jgi:endonuclease YncB( thermonuclease family)